MQDFPSAAHVATEPMAGVALEGRAINRTRWTWVSRFPGRVLVADDDAGTRGTLKKTLSRFGHEVDEAVNGEETIQLVTEAHDLVLMDVKMPGSSGHDVTKELRQRPSTRDIPIIMVTGLDTHEDRLRAVANGASDFLPKPIDVTELFLRSEAQLSLKASLDGVKRARTELEDEVARRTADLRATVEDLEISRKLTRQAQMETVRSLVLAAEVKDGKTAAHVERIGLYSAALARGLGVSPERAALIEEASPMHDVGKIGIPDAILLKPGALTKDERRTMETHTTIGARILSHGKSDLLRLGCSIALSHHEKWDGSGYPFGLVGEAIPFEARLVAIVDVFDALTSDRHYREAMPNWLAYERMLDGRGTHFDPEILDVFFDELEVIEEVQESSRQATQWGRTSKA